MNKMQAPVRTECEVERFSSFLLVISWAAFVIACRQAATCLLVTSAVVFLELMQTASGKYSVLLR